MALNAISFLVYNCFGRKLKFKYTQHMFWFNKKEKLLFYSALLSRDLYIQCEHIASRKKPGVIKYFMDQRQKV